MVDTVGPVAELCGFVNHMSWVPPDSAETDVFVYTSRDLWEQREAWWLIELPEDILDSELLPKLENDKSEEQNYIALADNKELACVLFELKSSTVEQHYITFSITPNDLYLLKVDKYSTSLILGLFTPCPSFEFLSPLPSKCLTVKTDCIIVAEKLAVLTCTPAYPRFDTFLLFDLTYPLKSTLSSAAQFCSLETLQHKTQASLSQIQLFLLLGQFACIPHVAPHQEQWLYMQLPWLMEVATAFVYRLREQCVSMLGFSWDIAYAALRDTAPACELVKNAIHSSAAFALQLLFFFCDLQRTSTDQVTIDDVVVDYRETSISETYQRYLQLISKGYQDNYFTLSIAKLARLCVRVELHGVPRLSLRDLRGYTVNRLVNLLPPELLDDQRLLSDDASQHHFYRGDSPAVQPPETYQCHCFEEFGATATAQQADDALLSSLVDSHLIQDAKLLAKSPHVMNPQYLHGYAVQTDPQSLVAFPQSLLPWDWKERLRVLYSLKTTWTLHELQVYLEPIHVFGVLCGYAVPCLADIAATYLLVQLFCLFQKALHNDAHGNALYLNRKLLS